MELGTTINQCANWIIDDTPVARILDNPFYTAICVTLIIFLIMFMHSRSAGGITFATYFYIFAAISASLFLYHRRFAKVSRDNGHGSEIHRALASMSSIPAPSDVPIEPQVHRVGPVASSDADFAPFDPFRGIA